MYQDGISWEQLTILIILLIIIYNAFIIWLIKKGVQNALQETLSKSEFREELQNTIAYGVLIALEQYNVKKEDPMKKWDYNKMNTEEKNIEKD